MDLHVYFRVLRRHWVLLLVFVLAGAGLGAATSLVSSRGGQTEPGAKGERYKATYTMIYKNDTNGSAFPSSFTNLNQIALLAFTGPVPEAVAKKLGDGETGPQVAQRIGTVTDVSSGTLSITAIGTDAAATANLANTTADELVAHIQATDAAAYTKTVSSAKAALDDTQTKIQSLKTQLAAVPPPANADLLSQQLAAYEAQYTTDFSVYQQATTRSAPLSPLTTLQEAEAMPIPVAEYDARLAQGRLGSNNVQSGGNLPIAVAAGSSESAIAGPVPRGFLGAFVGLLLGVAVLMLLERLDLRIRDRDDAERVYQWPVIAAVPMLDLDDQTSRAIVALERPLSPAAEAYRALRSSILFQIAAAARAEAAAGVATANGQGHAGDGLFEPATPECVVVMLASAIPGEGKTTSSANLAVVFAQAGARVLVVNCDFRRPTLHQYFGLEDIPRRVQTTGIPGLHVVTNVVREADPNPAQAVATQRQVVAAAREKFDVVILDTAPVLGANDAVELIDAVDVIAMAVRSGVSKRISAQRTGETLRRLDAPVVGLVFVAEPDGENAYYAYYQADRVHGYGHGHRVRRAEQEAAALAAEGSPAE